jgi:hypothetical protein
MPYVPAQQGEARLILGAGAAVAVGLVLYALGRHKRRWALHLDALLEGLGGIPPGFAQVSSKSQLRQFSWRYGTSCGTLLTSLGMLNAVGPRIAQKIGVQQSNQRASCQVLKLLH